MQISVKQKAELINVCKQKCCKSVVTNAVLIEKAVTVDICTSYSHRLHNTWIVGSQIYSKVN